jgi:hypothetical protein
MEYNRLFDVEAFDAKFIDGVLDQGEPQEAVNNAKRQKTVIPRRAKEKQMIAELLSRSGACIEHPGRKMRENLFWDELPNLTTLLKDAADFEAETAGERRTDEELCVSNITDAFFDDDGVAITTEAETEANAELDPAVLAAVTGVSANDDLEDRNEDEAEQETGDVDGEEVEITVGDRRFGKVTKLRVNPMCLKDVTALGRQKMVDSNVTALRHRRKQRARRERQFLQTSLINTLNGTMGSPVQNLVSRLDLGERREQPRFRKQYRGN